MSAILHIPLSALKCISSYPKDNKIICEIDISSLPSENSPETLDEIINDRRIDYALGNYKTFTKAHDLIDELRS
jgi:hypothetical protein